ncbi:hypothetical protein ABPG77_003349 [Micractinium sp. CCAP 211/92]
MRHVVVGGGVAGVCCAEELCRLCPQDSVALVSADRVLKGVSVVARLSRTLEELQLVEKRLDELPYPNLRMVQGVASGIDTSGKALLLADGERLPYDKLCICAGARPKQLPADAFRASAEAPGHKEQQQEGQAGRQPARQAGAWELEQARRRVLTIRDTDSVARLAALLASVRRVAVVGNGGIALELVSGLRGMEVTWVLKHGHIGDAFFDLDAAQFLLEELQQQRRQQGPQQLQSLEDQPAGQQAGVQQDGAPAGATQRQPGREQHQQSAQQQPGAKAEGAAGPGGVLGHAVGPRWVQQLPAGGAALSGSAGSVQLEYGCEVASVQLRYSQPGAEEQQAQRAGEASQGPSPDRTQASSSPHAEPSLLLTLTNGKQLEVDLVLLAIGVAPALEWVPASLQHSADGGLRVNRCMQSSDPAIYAAGDSAACDWAADESAHWFQMRLWSQARSMGIYAAHCMAGMQDQTGADMAFELFTHVTHFLGKKVVLLGLYNGQRLQDEPAEDIAVYSRVTEGQERTFVRVLLLRGRVQGAVLIGDTDLEETFENLIMDQLDVGAYGPALLDPDFELDHVFD